MKTSWGTKIIFAFGIFAAGIIAMTVISFSHDAELVSDNYYELEIKYQDRIEVLKNSGEINENISVICRDDSLHISLTGNIKKYDLKGEIYFYRASDLKKDFKIGFSPGEDGSQTISTRHLEAGSWKLIMNLNDAGKKYFVEKNIFIN